MLKIATVGTGSIVESFADAINKTDHFEYAFAYSRSEEKAIDFATKNSAKNWCCDLEKLAQNPDIDAVYIASPNSFHYEHAMLFMNHGKQVICEKPIASNISQLNSMISCAKANGVVLLEAMRPVFDPNFLVIKDNLHKLGKITHVSFSFSRVSDEYIKYTNGKLVNVFNPELSTGGLMDIGVYPVHTMVELFGQPKNISSFATLIGENIDGAGTILAQYDDFSADLRYSKMSNTTFGNEICGTNGVMVIDNITRTDFIEIRYNNGDVETIVDGDFNSQKCKNMTHEANEFARLIHEKKIDHEYMKSSVSSMRILDQIRKQIGVQFTADL